MLQVYSPRESESTFHRSLFLFVCNNESCVDNQSRVFRCQLPRENQFYSSESPSEDPENPTIVTPERFGLKTCAFCGGSGHLSCAKCNKVFYCSKDHQVVHWKFLGHKESCEKGDEAGQETEEKIKSMLLPEYELTIDLEENYANQSKKSKSESNDKDYQEALKKIKPSLQNEDLESVATESQEDKCFSKFRSVVSECPEHVLRYARTECLGPLWATDVNQIKTSDVPNCNYCGCERSFEFQVMPQLISLLGAQFKGDFATIVVYTCKNSCSNGPEYREEYVWKQMFQ